MKRFKLDQFIAGPAIKEAYSTLLSGSYEELLTGAGIEVRSDLYIAGQKGNLLSTALVSADTTLYNAGFFERKYSVKNPDIDDTSSAVDLQMQATDADIVGTIQFGDYAFLMTNETTLGTKYSVNSDRGEPDDQWYREPHAVVTYTPGTSGDSIDLVITYLPFNITPESPDIAYGYISGSTLILYVKNVSGTVLEANTVYSISGGIPNSLPFTYLLEQPLDESVSFARDAIVYGGLSGATTFAYTPYALLTGNNDLYSPYANETEETKMYVNPFKLKNMYDNNWQTEIEHAREVLLGARDYLKVGKTQETMWLSYKYLTETANITRDYSYVERVRGLYKYRPIDGHKSNIYSIRINNSGLNELLTDEDMKYELRKIIESTVATAVKKIAPINTQLWKIMWTGI